MAHLMAEPPNVRLKLSNRSENVLLVREMLTGVAETIALESSDLYDIRTAVTEACNNVVLHAYEGQEGPLEVNLRASSEALEVVVRDQGIGIRPRIRPAEDAALGIGLPLIQALVTAIRTGDATPIPLSESVTTTLATFRILDALRCEAEVPVTWSSGVQVGSDAVGPEHLNT